MSIDTIADAVAAANALAARVPFAIDSPHYASTIADSDHDGAGRALRDRDRAAHRLRASSARTSVASLLAAMPQAELEHAVVVDTEDEA